MFDYYFTSSNNAFSFFIQSDLNLPSNVLNDFQTRCEVQLLTNALIGNWIAIDIPKCKNIIIPVPVTGTGNSYYATQNVDFSYLQPTNQTITDCMKDFWPTYCENPKSASSKVPLLATIIAAAAIVGFVVAVCCYCRYKNRRLPAPQVAAPHAPFAHVVNMDGGEEGLLPRNIGVMAAAAAA